MLWELPDDRFATGVARLRTVLAADGPVESLRSDPLLPRSRRHRLVFVRFADLPLFGDGAAFAALLADRAERFVSGPAARRRGRPAGSTPDP